MRRYLPIRGNPISVNVRLERDLVRDRARRVWLRFYQALCALCPTIKPIYVTHRTKVALLYPNFKLELLSRLVQLLRTLRQSLNLSSTNARRSVAVFVQRDRRNNRLIRLYGTSLLPCLSVLR